MTDSDIIKWLVGVLGSAILVLSKFWDHLRQKEIELLNSRIHKLESSYPSLATRADLADLRADVVSRQNDISAQLNILIQALLKPSETVWIVGIISWFDTHLT